MRKRKSRKLKPANNVDTKLANDREFQLQHNGSEAMNESLEGPNYVQMSTPYGPPTGHFLNLVQK